MSDSSMPRPDLLVKLLNMFLPDNFVGVEIGTHHAKTTCCILKDCPKLGKLYTIDPYFEREARWKLVEEELSRFPKCKFIKSTAHEAVKEIPNDLDFIFIDGDHSYEGVLSDLNDYVPKVKSGGLVTGHDWTCVPDNFGIVQAFHDYYFTGNNKDLFKPLFHREQLVSMGLGDFRPGGWCEEIQKHLVHKKTPSSFPLWWLIKI